MKKFVLFVISFLVFSFNIYAIEEDPVLDGESHFDVSVKTVFLNNLTKEEVGDINFSITDLSNNTYNYILSESNDYKTELYNLEFGQYIPYKATYISSDAKNKYEFIYEDSVDGNKILITVKAIKSRETLTNELNLNTTETTTEKKGLNKEQKNIVSFFIKSLLVIGLILLFIFGIYTIIKIRNANK